MTAFIRVLTVSAVDSSPSLLLVSPNGSKILVNCGEGCQRAFLEYSQKLTTVKAICLTQLSHCATGGLPGVILTLSDSLAPRTHPAMEAKPKIANPDPSPLCLVGPRGTQRYLNSLRHFMKRDSLRLDVHESNIERLSVSKRGPPKKGEKKATNLADLLDFSIESLAVAYTEDLPSGGDKSASKKRPRPVEREVVSYLFKTPPIPGTFLIDKAIALGIPKGPLYGKLKTGQTVTFYDREGVKQSVEPSQVVAPSSPASTVQVLYYPTELVAQELFNKAKLKSEGTKLEVIVHIAPPDLFQRVGLPFWRDQAENIFFSTERTGDSPFHSALVGGHARSLLSPDIYRVPQNISPPVQFPQSGFRYALPMLEYTTIPLSHRGFNEPQQVESLSPAEDALEHVTQSGALAVASSPDDDDRHTEKSKEVSAPTHEIIFTGTGSAIPCKHRNVSGILLKQADGRGMLLDAGEGTVGQLLRIHENGDLLSSIKAIFISHPHADHHLGIVRLLEDRVAADQICIVAPKSVLQFLEEYSSIEPSICGKYCSIDNRELMEPDHQADSALQEAVGIRARTVRVAHCQYSFGVVLDETSFGRLVYSGDCRPSSKLSAAGEGANVLIHEATFENGMESDAVLKKHSTINEALTVAKKMNAKRTILTHFSQRYPKMPLLGPEHDSSVIVAFDYLRLRERDLATAPLHNPALRLLYPEINDGHNEQDELAAEAELAVPGLFANSKIL